MAKYYYKRDKLRIRRFLQFLASIIILVGVLMAGYVFFPLISWQIYFAPVFASQKIEVPIPKTTVVGNSTISDLLTTVGNSLSKDYTNSMNWYPTDLRKGNKQIPNYLLSIPKIDVLNAQVSTKDPDLSKHLVQFNSDAIPPSKGNTIIFGHSTLPQLFDKNNYKTIFANAYKLEVGDEIFISIDDLGYQYKIENIIVVDPNDTSVLAQDFSDSFLTIITCTPPGTIWKRLVIKARIETI